MRELAQTHYNLDILDWKTGEAEKPVGHFVRAFELYPNDRNTIVNCGKIFKLLGIITETKKIRLNYLERNLNYEIIDSALKNSCTRCQETLGTLLANHNNCPFFEAKATMIFSEI